VDKPDPVQKGTVSNIALLFTLSNDKFPAIVGSISLSNILPPGKLTCFRQPAPERKILSPPPFPLQTLKNWLSHRWPQAHQNARRLFHGRGQAFAGLEHLTLDWYPPLLVITSYQPLAEILLQEMFSYFDQTDPGRIGAVALQRRDLRPPQLQLIRGTIPERLHAREAGLSYPLLLNQGVNHGFFPDMAKGREWLRCHSQGKKILNLFAYTCSLSVAALAGGARQVVNLDMSKAALALGKTSHQLNNLELRRVTFLAHDLFKSFRRLEQLGPFDLVVLDPPAAQGKSFNARKDWPRILHRLPGLLCPGGEILACVSAPELGQRFLQQQFAQHLPTAGLLEQLSAGEDFPEKDSDKGWHLLHYRLGS
jgi:23S rRNA (cytosine1962-C5)-methyltransferase